MSRAWYAAAQFAMLGAVLATEAPAQESPGVAAGRQIAHDVQKGNCLACHQVPGDATAISMANIGPPIVRMRERFPDRTVLRKQIWDPTNRNPYTVMPPFGKHHVLTEEEIDLVVEYIYQY